MEQTINQSVVLAQHPKGSVILADFRIEKQVLPALNEGEILIENHWLSIDPYVRPRLNKDMSMVNPIPLGGVIQGEAIGFIIESKNPQVAAGQWVFLLSTWQRYFVTNGKNTIILPLPDSPLPKSVFLGPVGTAGRAAYFGMDRIARPKAGETVVISAASGAVGSIAGQIAKMAGAHVVGIAGGDKKCRYVVDTLGFDACVDYKTKDFKVQLRQACQEGVDVYFENVGGKIATFVAQLLNEGARVPVCGNISEYNKGGDMKTSGPEQFFQSLPSAPHAQFFLVTQWLKDYPESDAWLLHAVESGQIKYRETMHAGLEQAPQAFIDLFDGLNMGKQLVKI
ncbi:NADP-dependent oxidoreductase [Shewanella surugensis]|uniref:NADP-dependent oxidoreductase n=1 Tax=Shewanella surugensis TaxID=212020 RepID=A0ABT0L6X6_9GAMM|nr:NADP-dependent oxidoreductase [Shewanella surugensis]MCL1123240.1 NADP-dependent oxidoreductase [Shewanella surugensis]